MTDAATGSAARYAAAGVDVDANDRLIDRYRAIAASAARPEMAAPLGSFSGSFDLSAYRQPTLVASADGVGTKVLLASLAGRLGGVGRDLVNHCVNDILTAGAEPLFFLDYLAANSLSEDAKAEIVAGVAAACRENDIALLGGETADMPDLYPPGEFDLAGTIVGVVEAGAGLRGGEVQIGDALLGLPANGLHTNGYSLARDVLRLRPADGPAPDRRARLLAPEPELGEPLADALLRPHPAYWTALRPLLSRIKALAHVTGGGIAGNLERVLPPAAGAELDARVWAVPPIFRLIQRRGRISASEMFRVFNMGLGMIAVVPADDAEALAREIPDAARVGEVVDAGGRAGIERVRITGIGDPADA